MAGVASREPTCNSRLAKVMNDCSADLVAASLERWCILAQQMPGRVDGLRLLIRLTGPALLVIVISTLDDKASLWSAVRDASGPLLGGAVLLNLPVLHLKVVRWRRLLAARGFYYSTRRSYAAVLSSLYLGMLTPGRVGDALRIQYVRRDIGTPYAEGLAVTLMDRFCDLYVLAAVAAIGVLHFGSVLRDDVAYATWAAVAIALLAPVLLVAKGPGDLVGRLLKRFAKRWHANLDAVLRGVRSLVGKSLAVSLVLTTAAFAVNYVQGWLVARATGVELSYLDVASLLAATSLLGLLPISISGIGVRELFLALVFPALGFSAAQGVTFGLLVFMCINLSTVLLGFLAWHLAPPPFDAGEDKPGRPGSSPGGGAP
jgi:uncharacterized protein (TIRG00374 family)